MALIQIGMAHVVAASSKTFAQASVSVPADLASMLVVPSGTVNWNQNGAASSSTPTMPSPALQTWIDTKRANQLQFLGTFDVYFYSASSPA